MKRYTRFFISNTFISNARPKTAKNQAKAKQQPQAERLLIKNYPLASSTLSSKNNSEYFQQIAKSMYVSLKDVI